jgi:hypothetical protein
MWWTSTAWRGGDSIAAFVHRDPPLAAMTRLDNWCDGATFVDWDQSGSELPDRKSPFGRRVADGNPAPLARPSDASATRAPGSNQRRTGLSVLRVASPTGERPGPRRRLPHGHDRGHPPRVAALAGVAEGVRRSSPRRRRPASSRTSTATTSCPRSASPSPMISHGRNEPAGSVTPPRAAIADPTGSLLPASRL